MSHEEYKNIRSGRRAFSLDWVGSGGGIDGGANPEPESDNYPAKSGREYSLATMRTLIVLVPQIKTETLRIVALE